MTHKTGHRDPLPQFEKAARLRVKKGKARHLIHRHLRHANFKHEANKTRTCKPHFPHPITQCETCNRHDIQVKKQACLRRFASGQVRRRNAWIRKALWKRMARLREFRLQRYWVKGFIRQSIVLSLEVILTEAGSCKLAGEDSNELDSLD